MPSSSAPARASSSRPPARRRRPPTAALFAAIAASPAETSRFFAMTQGSAPIPEFFDPDNLARIMSAAT
jgi:hypothetical protein